MTVARQHGLEAWWRALSEDQRANLLPLHEGAELPRVHLLGLSAALGDGPSGAQWERSGFVFRVDSRVADFLEQKRRDG